MKQIAVTAFILTLTFSSIQAQSFGIGTDNPDPNAIMELLSNSKGLLIPRLTTTERNTNLGALTTAQEGLLIYNTTNNEFNYWDGTQWVSFPAGGPTGDNDWDNTGTLLSPSDGNTENVAIGTTNQFAKLTVSSTSSPSIFVESNNSAVGASIATLLLNNANNGGRGIFQSIVGNISGSYGVEAIYNDLSGVTSDGAAVNGIYNIFSGSGTADVYGLNNDLTGSQTGNRYGVYANITGSGNGTHYGTYNQISSSGSGPKFGIRNNLTGLNTDYAYGSYNRVFGVFRTQAFGTVNIVSSTGDAELWGLLNNTQSTGTGDVYGFENTLAGSGSGTYYGIYNRVNSTSASGNERYGVYNDVDGNQDGLRYGTYNNLTGSNDSSNYGNYNYMSNNGSGDKYADYSEFANSAVGTLYGNYIEMSSSGAGTKYGYYYKSGPTTTGTQIGSSIRMDGGSNNTKFGYYYFSEPTSNGQQRGISISLNGLNSSTGLKYGVFSSVISTVGGVHYGVAASADGPGHYGIYAENTNNGGYAGYFNGRVLVTGTFSNPSDKQFKTDIQPIKSALTHILKLQPKTYYFKEELIEKWGFPLSFQSGLIAQDVEQVFPNLVIDESHTPRNLDEEFDLEELDDPTKFKSVNYIGLMPYIIKAIQEQQDIITEKDEEIDKMKRYILSIEERLKLIEERLLD